MRSICGVARFESKTLDLQLPIAMPIQRATGGPETTWGNTINNLSTVVGFFSTQYPCDINHLPVFQASLGFESKFKTSLLLTNMTFLKGAFFPCHDSFIWLPLPSIAIKIGKLMNHPCATFKTNDPELAWRQSAYSLAHGIGSVPRTYPILGTFLETLIRLSSPTDIVLHEFEHKTKTNETHGDREEFLLFMHIRYGITECEILEVEHDLECVRRLPCLLPSRVAWSKLHFDYE
jgi:hypothetical protein